MLEVLEEQHAIVVVQEPVQYTAILLLICGTGIPPSAGEIHPVLTSAVAVPEGLPLCTPSRRSPQIPCRFESSQSSDSPVVLRVLHHGLPDAV